MQRAAKLGKEAILVLSPYADFIFCPLWGWLFISAWMHSAVSDTLCCFALLAVLCLPTFVEE